MTGDAALRVAPLAEDRVADWDAFVHAHPEGTIFHLAAWRDVIRRAFGQRSHYLVATRGGAVAGVMPLVHMRSPLFGSSLVSTPFCVLGGPLAEDVTARAALEHEAIALMGRLGLGALEIRAPMPAEADPALWQSRTGLYANFRRPITADADANLKAIPRKQRAVVRKALTNGLSVVVDRDADRLHRVYAESVRNLGTPVFSRRYFRLLAETFADRCDVLSVIDDGVPIASVLNFTWRDTVMPYYGGGTRAARDRGANDLMYWEVMKRAGERGLTAFDFGRSKFGTGAFAFKKNWGFTPDPLDYHYHLAKGAAIPEKNPNNPKYRLFINAWKHLPLPVANAIGPQIVRGIG